MEPQMPAESPSSPAMPKHPEYEFSRADLARERTITAHSAADGSTVGDGEHAKQMAHSNTATQRSYDHAAEEDLQDIGGGFESNQLSDQLTGEDAVDAEPELDADVGLGRRLRWAMVESAGKEARERLFVPADEIDRVVNLLSVSHELRTLDLGQGEDPNDIAHQICTVSEGKFPLDGKDWHTSRRRIFAILVLIGQTGTILEVLKEGIYDLDLPLELDTTDRGHHRLARRIADGSLSLVSFSRKWPAYQHEAFSYCQWQLLSPCFELRSHKGAKINHYILSAQSILPIIETDGDDRHGGFSTVSKIKLHPAHQKSTSRDHDSISWLALKKLRFSTEESFKAEVAPLKNLNYNENSHIIQLLATFQYRGDYNLVLEWADGGNLFDFWQSFPQPQYPPRNEVVDTSGFVSQDGRKQYGTHGDLKPENILWFMTSVIEGVSFNLGSFKLSDFGLSSFHSLESRERFQPVGISATYRAPEYDLDQHISQKYDMWSLGCVLLEHLTWYLVGSEGVNEFSRNRLQESSSRFKEDNFFRLQEPSSLYGGGATIKRCVQEHFDVLRGLPNCPDLISDILDFVQDRLLRMFPDHRCEAAEFLQFTQHIDRKCEERDYCTKHLNPIRTRRNTNLSEVHASFLLQPSQHQLALHTSGSNSPLILPGWISSTPSKTDIAEEQLDEQPDDQLDEQPAEQPAEPSAKTREFEESPDDSQTFEHSLTSDDSVTDGDGSSEVLRSTELSESARKTEFTMPTELFDNDEAHEATNLLDASTEYSASIKTNLPRIQEEYTFEFAGHLFQKLQNDGLTIRNLEHITTVLADNLKGFAIRLGFNAHAQIQRDIVYFAHKRRVNIQNAFENLLFQEKRRHDVQMPLEDKISGWKYLPEIGNGPRGIPPDLQRTDFELPDPPMSCDTGDRESVSDKESVDDEDISEIQDTELAFQQYRETIHNSSAYAWLLGILRREAALQPADQDQMEGIRTKILRSFTGTSTISRKMPSKVHKATFIIHWDPWKFVDCRESHELPDEALLSAVVLIGSVGNAQAIMCSEYLHQTWPSTGKDFARMIFKITKTAPGNQCFETLSDGTSLTATFDGQRTIITAVGVADSIAEVCQQVAWTGAALRSPPKKVETGLYTSCPSITSTAWKKRANESELTVVVDFILEESTDKTNVPGNCWHNMLKNPVLVTGFPIRAKSVQEHGIEMPLDIMAYLTGSCRAIEFDDKVILKGFSTMLTAIKRTEGFIIWHYTFHADKTRIPFFESAPPEDEDINIGLLDTSRHIVGWCSSAKYHTGGPEANHDVQASGLPPPRAGCILDKISLSAGKPIAFNASFNFPVTNLPPQLSLDGYAHRLLYLEKQFVIMWDEGEKRGWLVNGTSALLHLVRARLKNISSGNFGSLFNFDLCEIKEADNKYHPTISVAEVLGHTANRELVVGQGRTERYTEQKTSGEKRESTKTLKKGDIVFEAFVEHFMSYLEQIMDHQLRLAGLGGVRLKGHVRRHLEGWDFKNVLMSSRPTPSVTKLDSLGWGWVDFVRSINAVTLFGRGFGDLIAPTEPQLMCPDWKILPKGRYYLAASAVDLMAAMEMHGSTYSSPPELVHGLAWHSPISCSCAGASEFGKKHCDPVQVLLPTASRHLLKMKGPTELDQHGTAAFVLGHNFSKPLRWFDGSSIPEVLQESEARSLQTSSFTSRNPTEAATTHVAEHIAYSEATESSSLTDRGIGSSSAHPEMTSASSVEAPPSLERNYTKVTVDHATVHSKVSRRTSAMDAQLVARNPLQAVAQAPTLSSSRSPRRRILNFMSRRESNGKSIESATGDLGIAQFHVSPASHSRIRRLWRWPGQTPRDRDVRRET